MPGCPRGRGADVGASPRVGPGNGCPGSGPGSAVGAPEERPGRAGGSARATLVEDVGSARRSREEVAGGSAGERRGGAKGALGYRLESAWGEPAPGECHGMLAERGQQRQGAPRCEARRARCEVGSAPEWRPGNVEGYLENRGKTWGASGNARGAPEERQGNAG